MSSAGPRSTARCSGSWTRTRPFVVYFNPPQLSISRRKVQSYPQTYNGYWGSRDLEQTWRETP